jgi:adenylosuccinate synthase
MVIGLGFGDEGKGAIVDYLTRPEATVRYTTVVRSNGGSQTAHNVVTAYGRHHTFAQFGSGSLNGAATYLSRFFLVEPFSMGFEAEHLAHIGLSDPFAHMAIDRRALLTTPYHAAVNRRRENERGAARHGSCARGIGETMVYALANPEDAPRVGDVGDLPSLRSKLARLRDHYEALYPGLEVRFSLEEMLAGYADFAAVASIVDEDYLPDLLAHERVVFEGAQGTLLDQWRAFHPYATYSTTTFENGETLLSEGGQTGEGWRLGVLRAYHTRHGAGPFPTEDADLTCELPESHNRTGSYTGGFRMGHLDLVLARYALEVAGGADAIALTHLDRAEAQPDLQVADAYDDAGATVRRIALGPEHDLDYQRSLATWLAGVRPILSGHPSSFIEALQEGTGCPVAIAGYGPTAADKRELREQSPLSQTAA